MADIKQKERPLQVFTNLPDDTLLIYEFEGIELLSNPFEFNLKLISQSDFIDATSMVGSDMTVAIQRPDGAFRTFNGVVNRFSVGHRHKTTKALMCTAQIVPRLWQLHLSQDCRIYQEKTVQQIVTDVLDRHGVKSFEFRGVSAGQEQLTYCVQYRETAFNFISRLLEQEGIYYFFEHSNQDHKLIFADSPAEHPLCDGAAEVPLQGVGVVGIDEDVLISVEMVNQMRTTKILLKDFDFEAPTNDLSVEGGEDMRFTVYDYPGGYTQAKYGTALAHAWQNAQAADQVWLNGSSNCRAFTAGYRFKPTNTHRPDMGREFVLYSIRHKATLSLPSPQKVTSEGGLHYGNDFRCFPHAVPYRPPRRAQKPSVKGTQTATVVGPAGEEIDTDAYGRIHVQFHWDYLGKHDEHSSCWIRVAQTWAGGKWGALYLPRIGQEVIVSFLEGDPDRPLVIGSVYNADQMPPVNLPTEKTRSTLKSNSSKGGGGFNEIRFEDKKDDEEIFVHAQKNWISVIEDSSTEQVNKKWSVNVDEEILIVCGAARIHLTKDGLIEIEGVNIVVKASDTIDSIADGTHVIDGALVKINC